MAWKQKKKCQFLSSFEEQPELKEKQIPAALPSPALHSHAQSKATPSTARDMPQITLGSSGGTATKPAMGRPTEGLELKENEIYSQSIKILKGLKEEP